VFLDGRGKTFIREGERKLVMSLLPNLLNLYLSIWRACQYKFEMIYLRASK
jgi:hypothetical protein